jgi:hypothetical protein
MKFKDFNKYSSKNMIFNDFHETNNNNSESGKFFCFKMVFNIFKF